MTRRIASTVRRLLPGDRPVIVRRDRLGPREGYTVYVPAFHIDHDAAQGRWFLNPAFAAGSALLTAWVEYRDYREEFPFHHHTKAEAVEAAQDALNEADCFVESVAST
jgi:hypothetical protein